MSLGRSKSFAVWLLLISVSLGCKKQTDSPSKQKTKFEHGVYILCEGNYGWGDGSIFYYDTSATKANVLDAYKNANGFTCGNVAQSLTIKGDNAYLIVNNSNKIELLDAHTLERKALNQSLISPRYSALAGDALYVSDLSSEKISVLSASDLAQRASITCSGWSEQFVQLGSLLYAASRRSTLTFNGLRNEQINVLNPATNTIIDSIKLGGRGAQELVQLSDNELITSLEQDTSFEPKPQICWVNLNTHTSKRQDLGSEFAQQPFRLHIAGDYLWFLQGNTIAYMLKEGGQLKRFAPFGATGNPTMLKVLYCKGTQARILVANAKDYVKPGELIDILFDITTGEITQLYTTSVGVIPGNAYAF